MKSVKLKDEDLIHLMNGNFAPNLLLINKHSNRMINKTLWYTSFKIEKKIRLEDGERNFYDNFIKIKNIIYNLQLPSIVLQNSGYILKKILDALK